MMMIMAFGRSCVGENGFVKNPPQRDPVSDPFAAGMAHPFDNQFAARRPGTFGILSTCRLPITPRIW
jgi:hypothetical protein